MSKNINYKIRFNTKTKRFTVECLIVHAREYISSAGVI